MKHLVHLLIVACLCCCTTTPEPPDVTIGRYQILQYSAPGKVIKTYEVSSYTEKEFPPSVTFVYNGQTVTLSGSYQINEFLK